MQLLLLTLLALLPSPVYFALALSQQSTVVHMIGSLQTACYSRSALDMQDDCSRQWQQVSSCLSEERSEAAAVKTRVTVVAL